MIIEIVVYNLESALMAQQGKADRIELCDNPGEGGTTPSWGMMEIVRRKTNLDIMVMIRPRGGDFCYSKDEFEVMKTDVIAAKRAGADGVVLGILTHSGRIDSLRCTELIQLARPMTVTCHRAFDMTKDLALALSECIACGFDRILTSGGREKAIEGVETIANLNREAGGAIKIMPGSGVSESNVREIVKKSNVEEIHFSAMTLRDSDMEFRNPNIGSMGIEAGSEYKIRTVDPGRIVEVRRLVGEVGK